jgi:flavin-binding protein dodecin
MDFMADLLNETKEDLPMPGVYKISEVVGTSPVSFAEATKSAVVEASKTVRHLGWFEVTDMRGRIKDGKVEEFQVALKLGFKLDS